MLLNPKAESINEQALYIAIVIGIGGTVLRIFELGTYVFSYLLLMLVMAVLTAIGIWELKHRRFRAYLILLVGAIIFLLGTEFFNKLTTNYIGPLLELAILLGIIYYNLSFRQDSAEFFFIIIFSAFGFQLGTYINGLDVPPLIISTIFEQTLNASQYSVTGFFNPEFFFSLHMAEIFNLIALQVFKGRSWTSNALIFAGLDLTYPPLAVFRAMAVLVLIRHIRELENPSKSHEPKTELYPETDREESAIAD